MTTDNIAPCPFCGEAGESLVLESTEQWDEDQEQPVWYIHCNSCNANGPVISTTPDMALYLWNRWKPEPMEENLAVWQMGRPTLVSAGADGFVEGIVDGAFVLPMHHVENKTVIRPASDAHGYQWRALRNLVSSSADSFSFKRTGNTVEHTTEPIADTPWRIAVAQLIEDQFQAELLEIIPEGEWRLGMSLS